MTAIWWNLGNLDKIKSKGVPQQTFTVEDAETGAQYDAVVLTTSEELTAVIFRGVVCVPKLNGRNPYIKDGAAAYIKDGAAAYIKDGAEDLWVGFEKSGG